MLLVVAAAVAVYGSVSTENDVVTNHWHVHLKGDYGKEAAMEVAKRNGFSFVAPVSKVQYIVFFQVVCA